MLGLKHIEKIREYCDYIEEHLLNVARAWDIVKRAYGQQLDDWSYWSIDELIKSHDISKMSHAEFIPYQQKFFPVDGDPPEDMSLPEGIIIPSEFGPALAHHYDHNPHHWENWASKEWFPNEASIHLVCMVCDWMAMSMKFGGSIRQYYEENKQKIEIPDWAVVRIYEIFDAVEALQTEEE